EVSGRRFDVRVIGTPAPELAGPSPGVNGTVGAAASRGRPQRSQPGSTGVGGPDTLASPLQGNMWKVLVSKGDTVEEGQLLCIIEAMKMENEITAHKSGTITDLPITEGEPIQAGAPIATISSE